MLRTSSKAILSKKWDANMFRTFDRVCSYGAPWISHYFTHSKKNVCVRSKNRTSPHVKNLQCIGKTHRRYQRDVQQKQITGSIVPFKMMLILQSWNTTGTNTHWSGKTQILPTWDNSNCLHELQTAFLSVWNLDLRFQSGCGMVLYYNLAVRRCKSLQLEIGKPTTQTLVFLHAFIYV